MRNFIFSFAALAAIVANASSFIGFDSDSVRINPNRLGGYYQRAVMMHNEGYCNAFNVSVAYPEGMMPKLVAGVTPLDGLTVTYLDRDGNEQTCTPNLNVSVAYQDVAAFIAVSGYWDYNMDGEFEPYGAAKWLPGDHMMWEYNFAVGWEFRSGYVTFDGTLSSGYDDRGPILQNVKFFTRTYFWVGYNPGDVSGNDRLSIDDVSMLIDYLLGDESIDEFQAAAGDVNRDGVTTIADVSALIDMLL